MLKMQLLKGIGNMDKQLQDFAAEIIRQTKTVQSLRGAEAMTAQTELSLYIGEQTQKLMAAGVNIYDIQDCIRAGMEDSMTTDASYETENTEEILFEEVNEFGELNPLTHFVAVNEELITQFESGEISKQDFPNHFMSGKHLACDSLELITAVLNDYGKTDTFDDIYESGEVLAGKDGEAFIPEWLEFKEANGARYAMCEPMIYKTTEEVKQVYSLIEPIDQKAFSKLWNIKKLIKTQELDGVEAKIMKNQSEELLAMILAEYIELREFYHNAANSNEIIAIFYTY